MNADTLISRIRVEGNPDDAVRMAQYHKIPRTYLGVWVPAITELARQYWQRQEGDGLMECCCELWRTDIHEARILVGKVLTRCEWGHDDYSLKVENLPQKPPEPGQLSLFDMEGKS